MQFVNNVSITSNGVRIYGETTYSNMGSSGLDIVRENTTNSILR